MSSTANATPARTRTTNATTSTSTIDGHGPSSIRSNTAAFSLFGRRSDRIDERRRTLRSTDNGRPRAVKHKENAVPQGLTAVLNQPGKPLELENLPTPEIE